MVDLTLGKNAGEIRASHKMPSCGIAAGSTVLTLMGAIPVEFIAPGDRVITRTGARVVRSVDIAVVKNSDVVRISEGVLDKDRPEADILVSPEQQILIRDWRAKAIASKSQANVSAARLTDGEYIRKEFTDEIWMISLRFDAPETIYANGLELLCEPVAVPA